MLENLDYIPTPWGNAAKYGGGGNVTLDSPNFTGVPTAPTAAPGTNTTQIATTEFVTYAITLTGASLNDHISLTSAHGATSSNTASRIVLRDGSGNFSAGTITANLTGIASEAIKLQTARTINGIPFDGTADITIAIPSPLLLGETETTAYRGDRGKAAYDHINLTSVHGATSLNTASRIVLRDGSGNFSAGTITANLNGVASEATKLQTARTINGVPFDGTTNITIAVGSSLSLGETGTTAYRGDRGKAAYDHINLTSVHGATSSNTASRIVLRDGNGNFSAGTITASNITSTGNITGGSLLSLKGTTSADPTTSTPILRFYNSGESQHVQFRYSDHDTVHGAGGGLWLQGYGTGATPAWLDVDGAVYASAFYGPLANASYIQSTGRATSWGVTSGTSTGAYNALMGTSSAATWLLSGTSGGTFRCGIQALDSDGMLRFYQGANYFTFSGGTITATTFSGTLSGNVSGGTCAPSYLTIPTTASTTNGRMWIA